jgi:hypothetical protein
MALPQPIHVPADAQPSGKPPYDLSPNALASNQNRTERRGRGRLHLNSGQTKNSKQKPANRGKKTGKRACSSTNNPIVSHGFSVPDFASQVIPYCDPSLITTCPEPPTPATMCEPNTHLRYQVNMALHLAYNGVSGPYPVGDFLCDLYLADARFVKIAIRKIDPHGQPFWCHMMTGERLRPQDGSKATGKPVAMTNGTLGWMEDEKGVIIPPEWTFIDPHDLSLDLQNLKAPTTVPLQQQVDEVHPRLKSGNNPTLF